MDNSRKGQKWNLDETILAYYYYCQIPIGKIGESNPTIIRLSKLLGRTPGSVGMKMNNLRYYETIVMGREIRGLSRGSKLDEETVRHFCNDWSELSYQAKKFETELNGNLALDYEFPEGSEKEQLVKTRINQEFFRASVLSSYKNCCCITGFSIPDLLIASHIKPWAKSDDKTEKTNPRNGLCLNALHDRAFDKGLITVLPDYTIIVSQKLRQIENSETVNWILKFDKEKIILPEKFYPEKSFLEYHNDVVFIHS